jgi:hypothetical protein
MAKAKAKKAFRIELRAVAYRHGEWWIAHCLELDLVAEGKTPKDAMKDVMDLCCTQIEAAMGSGDLQSIFRAAPPEIWAMFSRAEDAPFKGLREPSCVERFEAREAALV